MKTAPPTEALLYVSSLPRTSIAVFDEYIPPPCLYAKLLLTSSPSNNSNNK